MAKFITASDAFANWKNDLLSGKSPTFFRIAEQGPLSKLEIGPKLVTLFGGSPGAGKTAFVCQAIVDAMRLDENLRAVVCNVEMGPDVLLDRQLARLSGVPLGNIRHRNLGSEHADRVAIGLEAIESINPRLCFVRPPFTLENIAATVDEFAPLTGADDRLVILIDYIQRIRVSSAASQADRRGSIDAAMSYLRAFAEAGAAVLVVSSVGRQKDNAGRSSYSGELMNLASFKESGELEYGADDAFILTASSSTDRLLSQHKARYGETGAIKLSFNGAVQQFEAIETTCQGNADGSLLSTLQDLWDSTPSAGGQIWQP